MLKSISSRRMFEKHPGFRKRYPRGSFWSGYEHHESTGNKDRIASEKYILNQAKHHNIKVVDDRQQKWGVSPPTEDTATPAGVAE